jgi:uncharacterized protein
MRHVIWMPLIGLACAGWMAPALANAASPACTQPPAASVAGAYRQSDGAVISVLPTDAADRWRITHFASGRSHVLHPAAPGVFESASDWSSASPAAFSYRFKAEASPSAATLEIQRAHAEPDPAHAPVLARRIALRERTVRFAGSPLASDAGGKVELFGQLTLPERGAGPFKTVVFVHGSDPVSSVGREWLPHLLAAQGVATLVFDKRGTGCSQGSYTQHFEVLAGDVVAAARWLRTQPEVRGAAIGLAGFSQGGWVAPLAARQDPALAFVAVGYGLAMSMADEERMESPLKLKAAGLSDAELAEFELLNAALHRLARDHFKDWAEFEGLLARYKDRPWMATAARQPSWLGFVMQRGLAEAKVMAPAMFTHFFQPFYEPLPTLEQLQIPMLWLIAEQDIEAPPGPTIAAIKALQARGKPVALTVFAQADHGLHEFEWRDGKRLPTRYAAGYFERLSAWIAAQSQRPAAPSRPP